MHELFNSKLLLFGEYGLMFDAMALAIPFTGFCGSLDFDPGNSHLGSTSEIWKFYQHLTSLDGHKLNFPFDLSRFVIDLEKGLYFNSNIPQQYGLGSSGALVAALFSRYAAFGINGDKLQSADLLNVDLALLEACYHGKSSGFDPLVSFLNQPLLLDSKKVIQPVPLDLAQTGLSFAMIDTHTTGPTGPLVEHFIDCFHLPEFNTAFYNKFIPANNGCIESLLNNNHTSFFLSMENLIRFQLEYFRRMIPPNCQTLISEALPFEVYIKLLGSGGGGYLLAISPAETSLNKWAETKGIPLLKVG